jgi:hypothetical protein
MGRSPYLLGLACAALAGGCAGSPESVDAPTTRAAAAASCDEDDYPGPWTACPEAGWVRDIVEAAGYDVAGSTGSALVARGNGHSFYIWATRGRASIGAATGRGCRIGSVKVSTGTGAMGDWRSWEAQGFTFWLSAGPLSASTSPAPCDLDDLVRESQAQAPPAGAG